MPILKLLYTTTLLVARQQVIRYVYDDVLMDKRATVISNTIHSKAISVPVRLSVSSTSPASHGESDEDPDGANNRIEKATFSTKDRCCKK